MGTTYSWNGSNGAFGTTGDWNPNGTPGTLDTAIFAIAQSYTVTGDGVPGFVLVDGGTVTFTGSIEAFGLAGDFTGFEVGGATAIFNGGTLFAQTEVMVGDRNGNGTLEFIGGADATLTATDTATALDIGFYGSANDGGGTPSTGSVLVDNSTLTALGGVYVGVFSAGSLTVSDGALVQIENAPVAFDSFEVGVNDPSVTGAVTVNSGATLAVGVFSVIGDGGIGAVAFSGGATGSFSGQSFSGGSITPAYALYFGGRGGSGTLTIDGATTSVTADEGMLVGQYGQGLVALSNGATLAVNPGTIGGAFADIELGAATGATGTLTVTGSAALTGTAQLFAGVLGTGSLDVTTGGTIISDANTGNVAGALGLRAGGTGTGVIDNGLWDVQQAFAAGYQGSGTLTVQDGGTLQVDGDFLRIARDPGSTGLLTVNAGTVEAPGAALTVGPAATNQGDGTGGSGTLEVNNQGVVDVGSAQIGGLAGGTGSIDVNSGALNITGTLSTGAGTSVATVEGGGIASNAEVTIGGGGGTALVELTNFGGLYDYSGGVTLAALGTLALDATAYLYASGQTGPLTLAGGTLDALDSAGALRAALTIDVTGGTTAQPSAIEGVPGSSVVIAGGITFAGTADVLRIDQTYASSNTMSGIVAGDTIDVAGQVYNTASYDVATQQLVLSGPGTTLTLNITDNGYGADSFSAYSDNAGGTYVSLGPPPCYLAGTRLMTPDGERAVETLRAGDLVTLASGGRAAVRWVGTRRLDPAAHPRPWEVLPVRIAAGALGEGLPRRDLLVSPDHALLLDGRLIEARRLINARTIGQWAGCRDAHYLHVELDRHELLLAEGVAAESYLDTGNRSSFANAAAGHDAVPSVRALHADLAGAPARRIAGACAPFATDDATVRAVWTRLAARADALGVPACLPATVTTDDPDLRLDVGGRMLPPLHAAHGRFCFALPRGAGRVRLRSRAAAPTALRPWADDRRRLGVAVARVRLHAAAGLTDVALDDPRLADGWWAVERSGAAARRWTDGDATLILPAAGDCDYLEIVAAPLDAYPIAAGTVLPARRQAG